MNISNINQRTLSETAPSSSGMRLARWKLKRKAADSIRDEFDEFISSNTIADSEADPVQWWFHHHHDFPVLSMLAFDIFGVPAMSAEVERVFSAAGK